MFIKKIKLQNFQCHKDTEIFFHDGLTVILGPTDQGKSAVIRALKWVLYNEPRGTDFITAGCKTCRVTLEMSNGAVIIRERDGDKNRYILQKDGQEYVFEGFGINVPPEIINAHGIPKIRIDTDKSSIVNLAEQLEPPFLLSESGGNRAKALGRLIGIHIIDAAQRTTMRDLGETQQRYKILNTAIEELKSELTQYKDLGVIADKILEQKEVLRSLREKGALYTKLCEVRSNLLPAESEIDEMTGLLVKLSFLDDLSRHVLEAEGLNIRYRNLKDAKQRFMHNGILMDREEDVLFKTRFQLQVEAMYNEIVDNYKLMASMGRVKKDLKSTSVSLSTTNTVFKKTEGVFMAEAVLSELINELDKLKNYSSIRGKLKSVEEQIDVQTCYLKKTSQILKANKYLNDADVMISNLSILKGIRDSVSANETALKKGHVWISDLIDNLNQMTKNYSQVLRRLSKCPTCLSTIDDETADKIVSELMKTSN